jgi:hypothetical protein
LAHRFGYFLDWRIPVSAAEKRAPDAADALARRTLVRRIRILRQKFLDVMRGVSQPFCHEDFRSIRVNRDMLPRCCGATGRV